MTEKFITYLRVEKRYSPLTVNAYKESLDSFAEYLKTTAENLDPTLLRFDDLRGWIMELSRRKQKPASVNRHISALRTYCRFMRREGVIAVDPSGKLRLQKGSSPLPAHIEQSRMGQIVDSMTVDSSGDFISMRNNLIILLLYATGIRLAELIAINCDHFKNDLSELKVRGKGDRERIIPVLPAVRNMLSEYMEKISCENICESGEKALILGKNGKRISRTEVYKLVNKLLGEAGVQGKRSPHVLRHTFATHLLGNGADLREIQELLGHSSLKATQIYTHNTIIKLKEAYQNAHPRANYKLNEED